MKTLIFNIILSLSTLDYKDSVVDEEGKNVPYGMILMIKIIFWIFFLQINKFSLVLYC